MDNKDLYFSNKLIAWYLENKRNMPWRKTTNPYFIWLSEIILQQTRVEQGLPYYLAFTSTFPTVFDLANASEEEVLKLWQGLGYYSRARNLHTAAKYVVEEHKGIFPDTYDQLLKLKGVGDYTASAIASICFNRPTAVVDGNVYRVLSRVFGIATPINSTPGIKEFKALATALIDPERPADFNQALMEFGALQCKPQNPHCLHCPFNDRCVALEKNTIGSLPIKINKTKIKKRYFHYVVIKTKNGQTLLPQRTGKGIWQGLYEFPVIEVDAKEDRQFEGSLVRFRESHTIEKTLEATTRGRITRYNKQHIIHKLSHQHLYTTFWILEIDSLNTDGIPWDTIDQYPVPVLISNFLEHSETSASE